MSQEDFITRGEKLPFDIDDMMARITEVMRAYPKAAMFELSEQGFSAPFEQLIACIISIRTLDEVTLERTPALFSRARTAAEVAALSVEEIDRLIYPSRFHERKAHQIKALAEIAAQEYGGNLPCDVDVLLSFSGVGVKCAHLVLGIACQLPFISVDVHVHRVTNRWGYIQERTPEKTTLALEERLPEKYWIEINRQVMPFGKHICTRLLPRCSTCPVLMYCRQVGVTEHR